MPETMKDADASQSKSRRSFRVPWIGWILFGLWVIFNASALFAAGVTPHGLGRFVGTTLSVLLVPYVLTWIVWLLSRRSQRVASILFPTLMVLVILGSISQTSKRAAERRESNAAMEQLGRTLQQTNTKLKQGVSGSEALGDVSQAIDQAKAVASGTDKLLVEATGDYLAIAQKHSEEYEAALAEVEAKDALTPEQAASEAELDQLRIVLERFIAETKELRDFLARGEAELTSALRKRGVPSGLEEEVLAGFRQKQGGERLPLMLKMREMDVRIGEALLGIVALLKEEWGAWRYDQERGILFDREPALSRYQTLADAREKAADGQIAAEQKLGSLNGQDAVRAGNREQADH